MEGFGRTTPLRGSVPTCAAVLTAALLAGCMPQTGPTGDAAPVLSPSPVNAPAPIQEPIFYGVRRYSSSDSLWKVCDEGRAIYALESGYRRGSGLAIVENASECTPTRDEQSSASEGVGS